MPRVGPVSETIHRHWEMLRLIPRAPRKIDAAAIEHLLLQQGIETHRRSIQRDLESLSQVFLGLQCDKKTKPYGWSWDGNTPMLEIPVMSVSSAVTFELLRAHLAQVLPRATFKSLGPHFTRAREVLKVHTSAKMARWPGKVRVVPRGQALIPANVPAPVLDVVYTALLEERQFDVTYQSQTATTPAEYEEVSPLGLVLRDGTLLAVCAIGKTKRLYNLYLHRMTKPELRSARARRPRGFELDKYIAEGHMGYWHGRQIKLRALVHREPARKLRETPIAKNQKLKAHDDEYELLQATVPDTAELRGWLLSYGPLVEVLAPKALRKELQQAARAMVQRYGDA